MKLFRPNLFFALILILLIFCLGTLGCYLLLPYMGWVDALYMTAITLSSLGYGEGDPMSPSAKISNIALMMTS